MAGLYGEAAISLLGVPRRPTQLATTPTLFIAALSFAPVLSVALSHRVAPHTALGRRMLMRTPVACSRSPLPPLSSPPSISIKSCLRQLFRPMSVCAQAASGAAAPRRTWSSPTATTRRRPRSSRAWRRAARSVRSLPSLPACLPARGLAGGLHVCQPLRRLLAAHLHALVAPFLPSPLRLCSV